MHLIAKDEQGPNSKMHVTSCTRTVVTKHEGMADRRRPSVVNCSNMITIC